MYNLESNTLKTMLDAVSRASSTSHPVYAVVSIKTAAGRMSISAFNGEFGIEARTSIQGEEEMSVCVNAATFHDIAGTISGRVSLGIDPKSPKKLKVESGSSKNTLNITDGEAFPTIDSNQSIQIITLTGNLLKSIGRVLPFTSSDEARPTLQGAMLCLTPSTLDAYAADGFTSAWASEHITDGPEKAKNILLPAKFLRELLRLVGSDDQIIVKVVDEKRCIFHVSNAKGKELILTSPTIDGNFPLEGIKGLYAGESSPARITANVSKAALSTAIRQVSAMGTQNMFMRALNGVMHTASPETEIGQAHNTLTSAVLGDFKLWVRADYVLRAIESFDVEVQMTFVNAKSPLYFNGGSFKSMVMPIEANLPEPVFDNPGQETMSLEAPATEIPINDVKTELVAA